MRGVRPYRGRFAPSPTGPLHFGSLVAAVGSYLQARQRRGEWLVRIEDVDLPRSRPGADTLILSTLEALGMRWDGGVTYQSERNALYEAGLKRLVDSAKAYPCGCTRSEIRSGVYPGTCRTGLGPGKTPRSVRVRTDDTSIAFLDGVQASCLQDVEAEIGDFVIRRADGLFAYQLAVVVDDAAQGVSEVVRGSDLLDSTPRQIHLQRLLGLPRPSYVHLPVAVNDRGEKLSKQTQARAVEVECATSTLTSVLSFLGQDPPQALARGSLTRVWEWAIANWRLERIPSEKTLTAPE